MWKGGKQERVNPFSVSTPSRQENQQVRSLCACETSKQHRSTPQPGAGIITESRTCSTDATNYTQAMTRSESPTVPRQGKEC